MGKEEDMVTVTVKPTHFDVLLLEVKQKKKRKKR